MSSSELNRNIKLLFIFKFLTMLLFLSPIFILFLQQKFTLSQAVFLQGVFVVSTGIFEVPAGVIADKIGTKMALILENLIGAIAISLYAVSEHFWQFLILETAIGLSLALQSGSDSALLYDTLLALKREDEYKKIYGKMAFFATIGSTASGILGGIMAKYSYELTFFATSIALFFAFIIALFLKEPPIKGKTKEKGSIKEAIKALNGNKEIKSIILFTAIIASFNQVLFFIYQPYYKMAGVDVAWFGVIFASFQIINGFASKYAYKYEEIFGFKRGIWILAITVAVSIFLLGNIVGVFSFVFIYLQQMVRGIRSILVSDYINKEVDSNQRVTSLSLVEFVKRIIGFGNILMLTALTGIFKLNTVINIVGVVYVAILLLIYRVLKKQNL